MQGYDSQKLISLHVAALLAHSVGAINALRFALAHPLVEADEGLKPAQHHLGMTTAARLKRRDRKLAPLPGAASAAAVAAPPDIKTVRIQTMENMLQVCAGTGVFCTSNHQKFWPGVDYSLLFTCSEPLVVSPNLLRCLT